FFFFQAEDGIRDGHVTGVQTCALPILPEGIRAGTICQVCKIAAFIDPSHIHRILSSAIRDQRSRHAAGDINHPYFASDTKLRLRSEERRVGKECGSWGWSESEKKRRGK